MMLPLLSRLNGDNVFHSLAADGAATSLLFPFPSLQVMLEQSPHFCLIPSLFVLLSVPVSVGVCAPL